MNEHKPIQSKYYERAYEALRQGNYDQARKICLQAVSQFELTGADQRLAAAFHILGEISYVQSKLADAETWYLKALSTDERNGKDNQLGYARSCHNLSAVLKANGKNDAAEEWLWKSIRIKESLGDSLGIAASYHLLGNVAKSRSDFSNAENWFLKALAIEQESNYLPGIVSSMLNLSYFETLRGNNDASQEWYSKALKTLERLDHASPIIGIGEKVQRGGDLKTAEILLKKALEITVKSQDYDGQSLSSRRLGYLALEMGDYAAAQNYYVRSVEIDENLNSTARAADSCYSLAEMYLLGSDKGTQNFQAAEYWFRKSMELRQAVSWRNNLSMYFILWCRRIQTVLQLSRKGRTVPFTFRTRRDGIS